MSYPDGGLLEHRKSLKANPLCFSQDKDRAVINWISHAWEGLKSLTSVKASIARPILERAALMVWQAQGGKPLFHFESKVSGLPMSWNRPQDGMLNYVRYEIGHMTPFDCGGSSAAENLCFQSARCNQHIQSSLPMDEILAAYFSDNAEVLQRIANLRHLYASQEWQGLLKSVV